MDRISQCPYCEHSLEFWEYDKLDFIHLITWYKCDFCSALFPFDLEEHNRTK